MWYKGWREKLWPTLAQEEWDLIIIGGGITGAGLLQQAVQMGLKTLLVEGRDFAWGTSSRSSKMVHGGLRYLSQGQLKLVSESVKEREHLLQTAPGLVEPLGFLVPQYRKKRPFHQEMGLALAFYDYLAGRRSRQFYPLYEFELLAPHLRKNQLEGGYGFMDAQTDDTRLVLRLIREAVAKGGVALNYARVTQLLFEDGQVRGVQVSDRLQDRQIPVRARAVINATGVWADELRHQLPPQTEETASKEASASHLHLRPLRGSHLVFEYWRLPVSQAISLKHPQDGRMVFINPWEGVSVVGTTDLDHTEGLEAEPAISPQEVAYLLSAAQTFFPGLKLELEDIVSTWAGVRPVVSRGRELEPSKESRDYAIWQENGLLTVTGGKLTTFRVIAHQALQKLVDYFGELQPPEKEKWAAFTPVKLDLPPELSGDKALWRRLVGRYGQEALSLVKQAQTGELSLIPQTPYLWAELRWAARAEGVIQLDDLLLRRLRLGLLLRQGGRALLPQLRQICQEELGWDEARWEKETQSYIELWRTHYSLPDEMKRKASEPDHQDITGLSTQKSN